MLRRVPQFAFVLALVVSGSQSQAQYMDVRSTGVGASATESIPVKPEKLRLVMWIKAQGSDPKAAIKGLSTHKERVIDELTAMNANKDSIEFSATQLQSGSGDSDQREQMQYMQMEMLRRSGGASSNAQALPTVYTAMCALKAEWPLPVQEGDALALLPATLQEQIEKRDLIGKKNVAELDAEAQEKLDELQSMVEEQYGFYGTGSNDAGKPTIYFIGSVSEDAVKAAIKVAFDAAVEKVNMLAEATGISLGKLTSVNAPDTLATDYSQLYSGYGYSYGDTELLPASFTAHGTGSVLSQTVDGLKTDVTVIVAFAIE